MILPSSPFAREKEALDPTLRGIRSRQWKKDEQREATRRAMLRWQEQLRLRRST